MWELLLDCLFPKRSLLGEVGEWVTGEERKELRCSAIRLEPPSLQRHSIRHLDRVIAAGSYADPLLRRALSTFKYRKVRGVGERLGMLLCEVSELLSFQGELVLCPVPLHWTRFFERGFNQAASLARCVGSVRGWEVRSLLRRVRATGSQVKRAGLRERKGAVRGAFYLSRGEVPPHVVLVDDVCTSGATLDACAKVLREHGAKSVQGLVVALG